MTDMTTSFLELSARHQRRAWALVRQLDITGAWRAVGAEAHLVGSLRMGLLMKHRDIDFHVYSSPLRLADSFAAVARLAERPGVEGITFRNLLHTDEACVEWHMDCRDAEGDVWQIDMIHLVRGSRYDGYFERMADRIRAVLTLETRATILYLKNATPDDMKVMGVEDLEIDLGVVRGLDYYTGMVFEAEAPALGAEKQICGGGSYTLSELFGGEKVFSTGFAIGFDRILLALEKEGSSYDPEGIDAYVVPVTEGMRVKAAEVTATLRASGVSADMDIMGRKMAKALKFASSARARYAVIVGEKEMEQDSVTLRDMSTGEQTLVKVAELCGKIKG